MGPKYSADDGDRGHGGSETVIDRVRKPTRYSCPEGHHDWAVDEVASQQQPPRRVANQRE